MNDASHPLKGMGRTPLGLTPIVKSAYMQLRQLPKPRSCMWGQDFGRYWPPCNACLSWPIAGRTCTFLYMMYSSLCCRL